VTVIVPWRPAPSRMPAFEFVLECYARHLPEFEVQTVDTDDDVFVLAACRNLGIAAGDPDEVVVVCDADTLPEPEPLRAAVVAARTSGLVHLPYTQYRWLGRTGDAQRGSRGRAGVRAVALSGKMATAPCGAVAHGNTRRRIPASPANQVAGTWLVRGAYTRTGGPGKIVGPS
jgi:hypothetical protein